MMTTIKPMKTNNSHSNTILYHFLADDLAKKLGLTLKISLSETNDNIEIWKDTMPTQGEKYFVSTNINVIYAFLKGMEFQMKLDK